MTESSWFRDFLLSLGADTSKLALVKDGILIGKIEEEEL